MLFVNSLVTILAIGSLVVNFPEYNKILLERRANLEMSVLHSTMLNDSKPILVGLDYTRDHENYHHQNTINQSLGNCNAKGGDSISENKSYKVLSDN